MARPNLSYLKNMMLFLFGIPCGLLAGLTGVAASVLAGPLLRFLVGLRDGRLNGVALTVTFFAALSAILSYGQRGFVHILYAVVFVWGQAVGALWAARIVSRFPVLVKQHWLWATLVAALGLVMVGQSLGMAHISAWHGDTFGNPYFHYLAAYALAALSGFASGLSGLGGVFTVPAAILGLGFSAQAAQGIAIAVLLMASLPGMLARAAKKQLEPASATWTSFGAIFGGLVGAFWAVSPVLTSAHLETIYGAVLTVLGVSLLWRPSEKE